MGTLSSACVVLDEPFPYDLRSGALGVELAEIGLQSWAGRNGLICNFSNLLLGLAFTPSL